MPARGNLPFSGQHPSHRIVMGPWFVLGAAMLWGTTGTAQALSPPGTEPTAIGAVRLALGGSALLVWALVRGALHNRQGWLTLPTGLAGASMAAYQVCFFTAVRLTGVAIGTIVAIGSAPLLAGLLSFLVHREPPSRRWILATVLAILGGTLLVVSGRQIHLQPAGILLAIGAGAAYAIYALTSKQLLGAHPPDAVTAVTFCLGAVLLAPFWLTASFQWLVQPRGLLVAFHLGLLATALAYMLFIRGLTTTPTATAVTLSLAEPLTASLLGIVVLGERLTPPAMLGGGLILAGLALLTGEGAGESG